jgi:hypothetical protein
MISVRPATAEDIASYGGAGLPSWCIEWRGWAYEAKGEVLALGSICWDSYGQAMCFFEAKDAVPAIVMHRTAVKALRWLRETDTRRVLTACDESRPRAAEWLRRLGFRPTAIDVPGFDTVVWECKK